MTVSKHPDATRLLVLRLLVLIVAVTAVFLLLAPASSADAPPPPTVTHVVAPGDTLWQIAAGLIGPGEDVRDMVDTIIELNGIGGSMLQAGMALQVPAE